MDSSALDALIRESWKEVRAFWDRLRGGQATRDSDPQPRLASELFEIFLREADPAIRKRALSTAFLMWGNTASAAAVDRAIDQLDPQADYWGPVVHGLSNAYARSGRRDEVLPKLHQLESQLAHERSRSAVLLALGQHYLGTEPDAAKPFYSEVHRIAVDRHSVQQAEGALYEIEVLRVGREAPLFTAETITGEEITLKELRGSIVCLEFWETSCGPCWNEFATLRRLREEFPPAALYMIGVSSDRDPQALNSVIEREGLAWPHIREPVTLQGQVVEFGPLRKAYNVWGVPSSFVIDKDGRIAAVRLHGAELIETIRALVTR